MADDGAGPHIPWFPGQWSLEEEQVDGEPVRQTEETAREGEGGRLERERITRLGVVARSGDVILASEGLAGWCAVCADEGVRNPVAGAQAAHCERCGRLLCLGHQERLTEGEGEGERAVIYCPQHAVRIGHVVLGCLMLLGGLGFLIMLVVRGCGG